MDAPDRLTNLLAVLVTLFGFPELECEISFWGSFNFLRRTTAADPRAFKPAIRVRPSCPLSITPSERNSKMIDADLLHRLVTENTETLCRHFFSEGKKVRHEWRIADTSGASGQSLGIELCGPKAGLWYDHATGEGGTFVKLLMENQGVKFTEAARLIGSFLGSKVEGGRR